MSSQTFNDERAQALHDAGVSEHAGFPNPATDRSLQSLDLNKLLIRHSASTYLMRIVGGGWRDLGIFSEDIVIIDRALDAQKNDLVIWWQGEHFVISHTGQVPDNSETWGVVTATIHRFRRNN